ncbi:Gas vesicle protein K [Natronoarchaeum philippinense]|uniref:Gas vesicle protein K n=1 Tax=Natronoarchaeum philippinense TaxID=558529 RepID=A0A285P0J6_NATPI|nr:gas vesicle protein K [Natronoarchaeum philippinense]SNZ13401.1 Gas vesicle protein K [Natronoarchaeum philippinense]
MTEISVDGDQARSGLMALLLTVVELLIEAMEREAVRRMESGRLADEEIERLGEQLAQLEAEVEGIKREEGIEEEVDSLRGDLDGIVGDAIRGLDVEQGPLDDTADYQPMSPDQSE